VVGNFAMEKDLSEMTKESLSTEESGAGLALEMAGTSVVGNGMEVEMAGSGVGCGE
jgi:hypothetical protein